ncbi:MAG: nitroreductase family protein [Polyangiaceae bacterium]|nr:nitroreductase family protein [Polyangiaceae bacterium]
MSARLFDDRRYPRTSFARFVVDPEKCNACRKCVDTCPGQLLKLVDDVPVNRHETGESALGCIGCKNCFAVCPEGAIDVRGQYRVEEGYYRTTLGAPAFPNPFGDPEAPPFEELAPKLTPVERVIYQRRSVRLFKKKAVPEAILRRVVEAGRFAPSQGNCQPWRFVVITDRALLDRIGEECGRRVAPVAGMYVRSGGGALRERLKTLAVNALSRLTPNNFDQRLAHGIDTVANDERWDMFLHAPALILVLGDKRGIGEPLIDCMLAAHNVVLAAHSLELGTCYVGFVKMIETLPELKRDLGIEWPFKVMTSIAVGWPRTRADRAVARERPRVTWFPADRSGPREE